MACLNLEVDETPKQTAAWKESCTKAIIPQVTTQCSEPNNCKVSIIIFIKLEADIQLIKYFIAVHVIMCYSIVSGVKETY